jgi:lipopolysaccharide transport system ATP-binding protein
MSYTAIKVEHLSKQYVLRHNAVGRYKALSEILSERFRMAARGQFSTSTKETFLALDDVSFSVTAGDRVGIIGRNGAGKSTLLKVLSRIVAPTRGRITIEGRLASLLEVGTGFHPELTGRENIFLNGAILGMGKPEIRRKFDEIVEFAEVERFLDTPVKRYSSGMYVRLAFAVAAHLEPEILVVDEVLAVGDAAFQKKCLGRMKEVSGEGRTILFVSHNMDAVQRLCNRGILLNAGKLVLEGEIGAVTNRYLQTFSEGQAWYEYAEPADSEMPAFIYRMQVEDAAGNPVHEVPIGEHFQVRVWVRIRHRTEGFVAALGISTLMEMPVRTTWSLPADLEAGDYEVLFSNDGLHLTEGQYKISLGTSRERRTVQFIDHAGIMTVSEVSSLVEDVRIINTKSGIIINQMNVTFNKVS